MVFGLFRSLSLLISVLGEAIVSEVYLVTSKNFEVYYSV